MLLSADEGQSMCVWKMKERVAVVNLWECVHIIAIGDTVVSSLWCETGTVWCVCVCVCDFIMVKCDVT